MQLHTSSATLTLHPQTGAVSSLKNKGVELILPDTAPRPLFTLRFRDAKGKPTFSTSLSAQMQSQVHADRIELTYAFGRILPLTVTVTITAKSDESFVFTFMMDHQFPGYLEWIELPVLLVPGDFVNDSPSGKGTLFWPAMEGLLIENLRQRPLSYYAYKPIEYPNPGWCGYYPGNAAMQFMAYMRKSEHSETEQHGFYFAAHDPQSMTKEIEYTTEGDGVRMIIKTYPGAIPAGRYQLPFEMVLRPFIGDWHDAAEMYRDWIQSSTLPLPVKLKDKPREVRGWIEESPIIVTYPITGFGARLDPKIITEYYPFTNALPAIRNAQKQTDSKILALVMEWESTAPWAPPYQWPPLGEEGVGRKIAEKGEGGVANMKQFADELHKDGNLLGLYCSGLAWTNTAATGDGTYNRTAELEEKHLIDQMCRGPQGEYESLVCNGPDIRYGYDFCTTSPFIKEVLTDQVKKMASVGTDYIQLLDQNLGAASYQCYDDRHGHSPAPGPWQAAAMRKFLADLRSELAAAGYPNLKFGCEAAAAEPYIEHLPLNDLRNFIGYAIGKPVPAFAYVFHEYTANFMGNQVAVTDWIDHTKAPDCLAQRIAYSFTAGDLLIAILKDKGELNWALLCPWDLPSPDQAKHWQFLNHLNQWRRGIGKDFLYFGRMLKPHPVKGTRLVPLPLVTGQPLAYPSIFTSRWQAPDGRIGQILVNYLETPQIVTVEGFRTLYADPHVRTGISIQGNTVTIPPMSAILMEG